MGFHVCKYLTREEAIDLGLRNVNVVHSSGDVTLWFDSGRGWRMPDMARLYAEIGWLPPQEFIDDVMTGKLDAVERVQTNAPPKAVSIGYLDPQRDLLPKPFAKNPALPEGFLEKLEALMDQAAEMGFDAAIRGGTGRLQTKGLNPPKM